MFVVKRLPLILVFSVAGFGFLNLPLALAGDFNFANPVVEFLKMAMPHNYPEGNQKFHYRANLFSAITKSESFSLIKGFTENGNVNIPRLEPSPLKISPAKPSPTPTPVPVPRPEPEIVFPSPTPTPESTPIIKIKETIIREIISPPSNSFSASLASLELKLNQAVSSLESKIQNLQVTAPTFLQLPSTNTRGIGDTVTNTTKLESKTLTLTNDGTIDGSLTVKKSITIGASTIFIDGDNNKLGIGDSTPETNFEVVGTASISGASTFGSTVTISGKSTFFTGEFQGTASASYFLTGNTLQVGGFSSAAYSRFGTATTTHAGTVSDNDDLLISGGFEVNGSSAFDGFTLFSSNASISGNFELTGASALLGLNAGALINTNLEIGGTASISGTTTLRGVTYTWPSADGSASRFLQTNGSGTLSWAQSVTSNSLDFDEIVNSPTLDANLNIQRAGYYIGIGAAPSTVFEVQGTASASYLLTGNTLQVGGFSSAAYSRFGTATATSSLLSTTNDLLISGNLEVDSEAFFDGAASISGNFQTGGRFIFGDSGDTGEINTSDWDISSVGNLSGIGTIAADGAYTQTGTGANTFSGATTFSSTGTALLVSAGRSEFQGTASASYLLTGNTLQVGGFSSAAYSRFGTATTGYSSDIDTTNDLLISGALEVDGNVFLDAKASISGNFQTAGRFIFGDSGDTGEINTNDWDISSVGNLSGIGTIAADGAYTQTGTGANTFSGATTFSSTGTALLVSAGRAEFQGTASASYLLTGNTLQVGGFASVAYSRFGTATTGYTSDIDAANDLLISGALEVDGNAFFDGKASISGNFQTAGRFIFGDSGDTGEINTNDWDISSAGNLSGIGTIAADGAYTQTGTGANTFSGATTFSSTGTALLVSAGRSEFQGTASASYLLTGNTLQVGGFASAAYSRFGTATTGYSSDIDTTNDLLISGALEVDGNAFFDGKASISGNFQTAGRFIFGDSGDTGEINTNDWDISSAGNLSGIGTIAADGAYTQTGTGANTFSGATTFSSTGTALLVSAGRTEFQGTASASYLLTGNTLQVGGFSSAAYSRFGTATATDAAVNTTNDLLISGALEVDDILRVDGTGTHTISGLLSLSNASVSGNFELTGNTRLGINSGGETTTSLEVGGTASISGTTTLRGITYTWPSADGSANQRLTTNGSGTLTWATAGGVSSNSLDFDEIVSTMLLDADLTINRGGFKIGIGAAPSTVFEVQGTASASYLLTGNTLQVGGFASAAYSRFGTATATRTYIDASNDLLISGSLEVDASASFDGNVILTANLLPSARASASATSQTITAVDSTGDVGKGTSLAIGTDDLPVIAYFDVTNTDLKVVKCGNAACSSNNTITLIEDIGTITASSGNPSIAIGTDDFPVIAYHINTGLDLRVTKCGNTACSSGNTSTTLDSTGTVGQYPSITIGRDSLPIISYYDATNGDLKVARCTNVTCSSATITSVDTTDDRGKHTAIMIGSDGLPFVFYQESTNKNIGYTHCGNLACSSGNTISDLATSYDVGQYISAFLSPDGSAKARFYDATNGDLRHVECTEIQSCINSGGIGIQESTNDIGQYTSSVIGPREEILVSYYDVTNADLRLKLGGEFVSIDTTGNVGQFTSIAVDTDGLPVISYYDVTNANLKVAKCAVPTCAQAAGGRFTIGSDIGSNGLFFKNIYAVQYWGRQFKVAAFDVAEEYLDEKGNLEPGDVVSLTNSSLGIERSLASSSYPVLGIISSNPAIVLGDWSSNDKPPNLKPVALQGRVPVKISDENGLVKAGDRLTLSKTKPGVAMKMTESGQSIGIALENGGSDKVLVFVNLSYWAPADAIFNFQSLITNNSSSSFAPSSSSSSTLSLNSFFSSILNQFKKIGVVFEEGIVRAKEFIADKITAKLIRANNFEIEDSATGELYCVRITNGDWDKKKGECGLTTPQSTPTPTSEESTEVEPLQEVQPLTPEPSVEPTLESTPEAIPESRPEPTPSPTIEPNPTPEATPESTPTLSESPKPSEPSLTSEPAAEFTQ